MSEKLKEAMKLITENRDRANEIVRGLTSEEVLSTDKMSLIERIEFLAEKISQLEKSNDEGCGNCAECDCEDENATVGGQVMSDRLTGITLTAEDGLLSVFAGIPTEENRLFQLDESEAHRVMTMMKAGCELAFGGSQ